MGQVADERHSLQMTDYDQWSGRLEEFSNSGVTSLLILPLLWQEKLVGTLNIADQHKRRFDKDDINRLELFASLVAAAIEQRQGMIQLQAREQEAHALSRRLSKAQEEERVRIAHQLHDAIGHRLIELHKGIEAVRETLGPRHAMAQLLGTHLKALDETYEQARSLELDLNDKVLADLGLSPAARQYVNRLKSITGVNIRLTVTGRIKRLPAELEQVAFRGLQEAMLNALRHAQAEVITARMHFGARSLRVSIADNGLGFATGRQGDQDGGPARGLAELERQIHSLQGEYDLESMPGQGTTLSITLPVHKDELPTAQKCRVLIVNPCDVTRLGLRSLLAQDASFLCIGEAVDGLAAISQVELNHPDLVLVSTGLPLLDGIESTRQITRRFPSASVVVLYDRVDSTLLNQALLAGACGFLLLSDDSAHMLRTLRLVRDGEMHASDTLSEAWSHLRVGQGSEDQLESLTLREREVFHLVVAGNRNRMIAQRLGISVRTVEVHRRKLMSKLGLKNLAELVQFANVAAS